MNSFVCTQLNSFKHCSSILIQFNINRVCTQLNGFKNSKWLNGSIWHIDGMLTVKVGVMAMKGYSIFPKAPGLEPYH